MSMSAEEGAPQKLPFLSPQWVAETNRVRQQFRDEHGAMKLKGLRINLVVSEVPGSEHETVDAHMDSGSGEPVIDLGHLDSPDITIAAPFEIAKSIFVSGEYAKAMEAMQLGRIKIDGSMFKMMNLASIARDKSARELSERIRAITL